jgi:hypothetical protein
MAWFGSVSGAQVDEFAKSLALELARDYPPALEKEGNKTIWERKLGLTLQGIFGRAREFREEHKLGLYKKARLANTFRWELQEMGYDAPFIEKATEALVIQISRKK